MATKWVATPLTGTFGAELAGGQLRDLADANELMSLLEQHLVLVFRDENLSPAEQTALARVMGEPTPAHPVVPGLAGFPEILELDAAKGGKNARWHTDVTFVESPPAASILVGDVVPVAGGDTIWADCRTAYERLAKPLRDALDQLSAVHRISPLAYWGEPFDTALSRDDAAALLADAQLVPPVQHPVVRVHPSTRRRSLFVNPGFTTHIVGLSRIESDHLLRLLFEHQVQPELTLRHHWRPGDVVMWDNRSTMHYATDDYEGAERRMRRITLRGTRPVGPNEFTSAVVTSPVVAVR